MLSTLLLTPMIFIIIAGVVAARGEDLGPHLSEACKQELQYMLPDLEEKCPQMDFTVAHFALLITLRPPQPSRLGRRYS